MFDNIEDYEQTVGFKTNESFRDGFRIARTKMKFTGGMIDHTPQEVRDAIHDKDRFKRFLEANAVD